MIPLLIPSGRPLVVFTDLDGTLIDHHTYDPRESLAAVRILDQRGAALVFCSSKTFAEQIFLQQQIGICQPFIFENGSAAAVPGGFFAETAYQATQREAAYDIVRFAHAGAAELRAVLAGFKGLKGFADVSDAELAAATGLSGAALQRARERRFTETLLSPLDETTAGSLTRMLRPAGFTLSRGGRFYTVQSARVNKGKAVCWMMDIFRRTSPQIPFFAAVGDSPNDARMLETVDLPFLVQGPDRTWAKMDIPHLIKIDAVGPAGFSAAVQMLSNA